MRAESYTAYVEAAIAGYAQDNVAAGRWPEVGALERSRANFESLLPQGLATPEHYLYEILASPDDQVIGFVWLGIEQKHGAVSAYIYGIEVEPEFRRHSTRSNGGAGVGRPLSDRFFPSMDWLFASCLRDDDAASRFGFVVGTFDDHTVV